MPILRIRNLTDQVLVFDRNVFRLNRKQTTDFEVTVAQMDALRPKLATMANAGLIEFAHINIEADADDDAEFVTLAGINAKIVGGGIVGPGGGSIDNSIMRWDGITGGAAQNSLSSISDAGEVTHQGTLHLAKGADVASAATLTLGSDGNSFDVTGTTTVTAISTKPIGTLILLQFDASLTLTHNATTLRLFNALDITTGAGEYVEFVSLGSGNWAETSRSSTLSAITASQVDIAKIGSPTDANAQARFDTVGSSGTILGGVITDAGSGQVTVAAGSGYIRATNNATALAYLFDWAGATPVSLVDVSFNFIYVEYNAGVPQIVATVSERSDTRTNLLLGTVYRTGTELHITPRRELVGETSQIISQRMVEVDNLTHASGHAVSETGTRNIAITSGVFWLGMNRIVTTTVDTSIADTFRYFYRDGGGGWTEQPTETQINNTQYDDGSGVLAALGSNRYGVAFGYFAIDSDIYVVFGRGNYNLTDAGNALPPSDLPPHVQEHHATLAFKVIVQESSATFNSLESAFVVKFSAAGVTSHADLSDLVAPADHHTHYSLADGSRGVALDGTWRLQNTADPTKEVDHDVSAVTTGTLRTVTYPDANVILGNIAINTAHAGTGGTAHAEVLAGGAAGFMPGSDKTKINGIEASADVTDAANVEAAGAAMLAGQLGGTSATPDVRGLRETSGPTLLTMGDIADGQGLIRSGSTIIGGASGGGVGIQALSGFSTLNYYERAAGSALGGNATGWEAMTIAILDLTAGLSSLQRLVDCDGGGAGWWVGAESARPKSMMRSGAGAATENFFGYWLRDMSTKLLFVSHISYDGATMRVHVNGELFWSQAVTGMTAATAAFRLGGSASNPADEATIAGFAFKDDGVLTDTQRRASIVGFLATGGAIEDGAWTSKYEISGETVGAAPATLSDGIASLDLTLIGALSVVDDASLGLARTSEFDVDSLVVRNGNLIGYSAQAVSVVGPTTTTSEIIQVDCSGNAVGLTLPAFPTNGVMVNVFDQLRNAGTNAITITRGGTQLIDGLTTYVMQNDGQAVSFMFDGTDWHSRTHAFVFAENGEGFDSLGEIHVGTPEVPAELVVGGGDSYVTDVLVYTEDAVSTFTDRTGDATFAFDATTAGNAIYMSSDKQDATDYLRFPGIKVTTSIAIVLGAGAIICEYWNGSAWVQMTEMVSDAGGDYRSHANTPFERVAVEQIRYSQDAVSVQWAKNDPPTEGTTRFWVRYRIVTAITTSPTITQIKLHTDRFEINSDGFAEMFGKARALVKLPWDLGLIRPAAASPLNQDIYLSDNIDVGRVENKFVSGATDRIGFATLLPGSTCTSCPAIFTWKYFTDGTSAGNVRWVVRWGFSTDGDNVYPTAAAAPTTGGNEQSTVLVTAAPTAINTQEGQTVSMNIEDFIAERAAHAGDVFWMSLERTGGDAADTHTDDITLIAVKGEHVTWTLGGHL